MEKLHQSSGPYSWPGGRYNEATSLDTSETGQNFLIITSSAAPGTPNAYIQITPSASMESNASFANTDFNYYPFGVFEYLYYYCENHYGMLVPLLHLQIIQGFLIQT